MENEKRLRLDTDRFSDQANPSQPTSEGCTSDIRERIDAMTYDELRDELGKYQSRRGSADQFTEEEKREISILWHVRGVRKGRIDMFMYQRGKRYAGCRFENYETTTDEQAQALADIRDYAANIFENVRAGKNVVIFGPKGTGKDHLMTALSHRAIGSGLSVSWHNGVELYADCREAMRKDEENVFLLGLKRQWILSISDPLPPTGALTEYQQQIMFRLLDHRYSENQPTWMTVNVSSRTELDSRMGAAIADRMIDGALCVFCNWESKRKPQ